jgi:CubicO group peptidase (beta-lactamase class C family)
VRSLHFPDVPITFRMLLEHDSSLTTGDHLPPLSQVTFGADSPISLEEFLSSYFAPGGTLYDPEHSFNHSLPGTVWEYSNIGYCLLGYVVERISGVPFDQYCTLTIFNPLGMERTSFRLADLFAAGMEPAMPYIHTLSPEGYAAFGHNASADYPNGGLRSSASDVAKFLQAHMNGGTYAGATILEPETVALMHTKYNDVPLGDGWTWGFGLGFDVTERGPQQQEPSVSHTGEWFGVATTMGFRPGQGVGVIVLANAAPGILTAGGPKLIHGREFTIYSFVPERLANEAAAR